MFYLGRLISAFFNQLFRWLFWNKTGQKVLFTIVIFAIAVCFIKLGEVSAVETVQDLGSYNYSYYDSLTNNAIIYLNNYFNDNGTNSNLYNQVISSQYIPYFYYGSNDGSSYNGATPLNSSNINLVFYSRANTLYKNQSNYDYRGVTGWTMYECTRSNNNNFSVYTLNSSGSLNTTSTATLYAPLQLFPYYTDNWANYVTALKSGNEQQIISLLEEINEDLSNTTPDQESEDSVIVDSSATDSVDTSEIDSVFSSAFTSFANKFTYYDLSDADQWVITINGTRIVLRSDILYNMIHNTWFYPMLQLLWYYIFGHYAFVWLTNLIHKIKDGSILDGLEVNEVISKEML